MSIFNLPTGHKLLVKAQSVFYRDYYQSRIIGEDKDGYIITMPLHQGRFVLLPEGTSLNVYPFAKSNEFFDSVVINCNTEDRTYKISKPFLKINTSRNAKSETKVIAVTSGKGGVGKTCFSINLSIILSQLGKKAVLIDADMGMANIDLLLGVNAQYNLMDVTAGKKTISDIIIDAPGNFKLVPGGSGFQELTNLSDIEFNRLLNGFQQIGNEADYIIIDTGSGLAKAVTNFILISDKALLITTPEPHSIADACSLIKLLSDLDSNLPISLVVNRVENKREGNRVLNIIKDKSSSYLKKDIQPLGYIPEDRSVIRSLKRQMPLCIYYKDSPAARAIMSIGRKIVGLESNHKNEKPESFLERLATLFKQK